MAAVTEYLLDTSLINRLGRAPVAEAVQRLGQHRMRICAVSLLEVGVSAVNGPDHTRRMDRLLLAFPTVLIHPYAWERAMEVQGLLAERGEHRSAKMPDLVIAATAELHDLAVLHCDRDFETVAKVTGQPAHWVAPD